MTPGSEPQDAQTFVGKSSGCSLGGFSCLSCGVSQATALSQGGSASQSQGECADGDHPPRIHTEAAPDAGKTIAFGVYFALTAFAFSDLAFFFKSAR
jgi:hypothetical protein